MNIGEPTPTPLVPSSPSPQLAIPDASDPDVVSARLDDMEVLIDTRFGRMESSLSRLMQNVDRLTASPSLVPPASPSPAPLASPSLVPPAPPSLSPSSPAGTSVPPSARPFAQLHTTPFSGSDPESFLNALNMHYQINAQYYSSSDDIRRVFDARLAMIGSAATWYDNLARSRPTAFSSWSAFQGEFDLVYMSARGLDNVFDKLRSLRMTGSLPQFNAEFNSRRARCPPTPEEAFISDYRRALPGALAAELERSRISRFGGTADWPTLAELQSSAAALATAVSPAWSAPHTRSTAAVIASAEPPHSARFLNSPSASSVSPSTVSLSSDPATAPIPSSAANMLTGIPADVLRRRAVANERERQGLCRYCGSPDHEMEKCPVLAKKEAKVVKGGKV